MGFGYVRECRDPFYSNSADSDKEITFEVEIIR
jgi:hypothetical protein